MARVLIVDDEPAIVELIHDVLEQAGYETYSCDDGQKAWELIQSSRPDLIITDVMLPSMDGYTLQNQIAQTEATSKIPVIVMSALVPAKTLFRNAKQVVGFMVKPFTGDELVQKVQEALGARPAAEPEKKPETGEGQGT
ncbi:MAG: hypothetical protein A3G41_08895 [Elusimicrobia bacterium RIFCSPLOWO2_12_FULL_59_9]|nr:MAG: hypothetical protein A3G41_08895 [Elusimicrobia bacterium RIFCSPLOWO2_12_FULL_59_9]